MMKAQTAAIVLVAIAPDVAVNHALQSQAPAPTTCRDRGTPTLLKLEVSKYSVALSPALFLESSAFALPTLCLAPTIGYRQLQCLT
jgi:hypothetical protein